MQSTELVLFTESLEYNSLTCHKFLRFSLSIKESYKILKQLDIKFRYVVALSVENHLHRGLSQPRNKCLPLEYVVAELIIECSSKGYNFCSYFVLLYAEAWLFNYGDLIFEPLYINRENRRNLWHVNELYSSDSVDSHPRIGSSEYTEIED